MTPQHPLQAQSQGNGHHCRQPFGYRCYGKADRYQEGLKEILASQPSGDEND
jgi:hypothetical protein